MSERAAPARDPPKEADSTAAKRTRGCINSGSCCGGFVFVDEAAEQLASSDHGC
jgi:hypothetical protein